MIRIEPTANNLKICSLKKEQEVVVRPKNQENKKKMLISSLAALAAAGATAVTLKKTKPITYAKALENAGIEIRDGVAVLVKTGEKFTGKIQRFETRSKRETVNFVNGMIKEKLYHNPLGKELEGVFYEEGQPILRIWKSVGQEKNAHGFSYAYKEISTIKSVPFVETKEGFAWARRFLEKVKR